MINLYQKELISQVYHGNLEYDKLPDSLKDKLYQHFEYDMPYGTAKARTGDPEEFIFQHLNELIGE